MRALTGNAARLAGVLAVTGLLVFALTFLLGKVVGGGDGSGAGVATAPEAASATIPTLDAEESLPDLKEPPPPPPPSVTSTAPPTGDTGDGGAGDITGTGN